MQSELVIGIAVTLIAFLEPIARPTFMGGSPAPEPFGVLPYLVMLFGLGWMIRIYRGPGDEPRFWRFLRS